MKRVAFLPVFLFYCTCYAQKSVRSLLDSVLIKAKESSLYAGTVQWDSLEQQVYGKAVNAGTVEALKPAFETLLNGLRDHHGKVIDAKTYRPIAWFTDSKNRRFVDPRKFDGETWKIVNDTASKFQYKVLGNRVGYLKIVGIAPNVDIEKESRKIRDAVMLMSKQNVDKWIIDLRYNGGGNMHPMIAGIAPLVGNGVVGSLTNLAKEKMFDWEIVGSNLVYGGYQAVTLPDHLGLTTLPKIAVLTSRWTVSSGEIVATCLKGRPGTMFFGESTGGYSTNIGWDVIGEEVILNISTGIFTDRNGVAYEHGIPVDVEIPFEVIRETAKDPCVLAAKRWLMSK